MANAGAVLLWPFLGTAFRRLGYREETTWAAGGAVRAVQWLHGVATGAEETPEPALVIAKILCGVPLHTPTPRRWAPSEVESTVAEQLLESVCAQWSALGSLSVEGLRQAFLRRPGLVEARGRDWHLRLERRTEDILLDRLPWGIGLVRHRWMTGLLTVEW